MNEALMLIVAQTTAFFELSDDDVIDPEIAISIGFRTWAKCARRRRKPRAP
jgi:hypothetical protein